MVSVRTQYGTYTALAEFLGVTDAVATLRGTLLVGA
jgi:hypothetical protein